MANTNTKSQPRWLGYSEAADYLGASPRQVKRWVAQGRLGYTKLGLRVSFSLEQLDAFLAANTFGPSADGSSGSP